jgi:hypothetical protein
MDFQPAKWTENKSIQITKYDERELDLIWISDESD